TVRHHSLTARNRRMLISHACRHRRHPDRHIYLHHDGMPQKVLLKFLERWSSCVTVIPHRQAQPTDPDWAPPHAANGPGSIDSAAVWIMRQVVRPREVSHEDIPLLSAR